MPTPNFRGRCTTDRRTASEHIVTRRKDEGLEFSLDQRDGYDLIKDTVTVHCWAKEDGTLRTVVTVKGHKPIELVTVRT